MALARLRGLQRQPRLNIGYVQNIGDLSCRNRHGHCDITAGKEQHVWAEFLENSARMADPLRQLDQVPGQGAQAYTVHSRCRDGGKGDVLPGDQVSFHAAFDTDPENSLCSIPDCLKDGESWIHSPSGPAGANQQPHDVLSLLDLPVPILMFEPRH